MHRADKRTYINSSYQVEMENQVIRLDLVY
jgi:hypothetical protein